MGATSSTYSTSNTGESFFLTVRNFPPILYGRINVIDFLNAATDVVSIVDRLGTFHPVRSDMQGNINRIKQNFRYDNNSCLLELVLSETSPDKPGSVGVLWLNKAILFMEIMFGQILHHVQRNNTDADMQHILTVAYERSIKQHHNWFIQQSFNIMCSQAPTMRQFLMALGVRDRLEEFKIKLEGYHRNLHLVRCKIDELFNNNRIL